MMLKETSLQVFGFCLGKWQGVINYLQRIWELIIPKFIKDKMFDILRFTKQQYENIVLYFQITWTYFKPKWDKFLKAIIALTTMMSTFRVAGQLISMAGQLASILLSILPPVIVTIPILGFISFSNSTMILILGSISLLAGYIKFKDLLERANLDNTILENKTQIAQLKVENENLKETLRMLEETVRSVEQFLNINHVPSYVPQYDANKPILTSISAASLTQSEQRICARNMRFLNPFSFPQPAEA